jgi:diguanylate cyclase (GGDEF)-like protein
MILPAPQMRRSRLLSRVRRMAWVLFGAFAYSLASGSGPAHAIKSIVVSPDQERIEITTLGELYEGRGDSLQVETAAGADGMQGRMSVNAATPGTNPNWIVFALTNPTEKPIERWLAADRYNVIGSGAVWPDLDARRIEFVTPSVGFVPERVKSDRADLFRITLEPGQTITYVAELSSERFARVYLWRPIDYELKIADRQLFNGVMLGLTGLMAIFLTAIFAANHKLVFPAAALVAWCTLAYLCVDFGFFHKLFQLRPEANAVYRAATESALAASLVIFIHVFLRLALWHGLVRMLISVWLLFQLSLIAVAVIDPRLASTFARLSFIGIGGIGAGLIVFLALRGQDRALSLVPTWILFLVWTFGAAVALAGELSGEIVGSGLVAGLVLILLLIGFTVTQFAFRSVEPLYGSTPSELQGRSAAVDGAGAAVWEWNPRRDEIKVSPVIEAMLGLSMGDLSAKVDGFCRFLHPADRERFRLSLWSAQERNDGKVRCSFRVRHADNSYRWFEVEAGGLPGEDLRSFRCVGLMRDVTDVRRAQERLLHDAVFDSLTSLPNKALLMDRLDVAMTRAKTEPDIRPAIISIDIDKFKGVNSSVGQVLGDSLLLTIARRMQRHLSPGDTLARVGGDEFAMLFLSDRPVQELAAEAERIRRSLRSPIKIAGQEVVLTASLGLAAFDGKETSHEDLLRKARVALYRAKRGGADRIEVYRDDMNKDRGDQLALESDLRNAIEKRQLKVLYQPIIYLPTEELAGFESIVRWDHPSLGSIDPATAVSFAEESDLVVKLGSHVLLRAARDAAQWQKDLPRTESPLFVSVNVSSRQLFRQDLIQEIRHILGRNVVSKGTLKLEVSEQLVMENPEQSGEILEWLRGAGAELSLDGFGSGHSALCYLERLPFDTLKIDRNLLESSGSTSGNGSLIVRSMVAFAHELGRKVVAEGVGSQDDVVFLRSIGCEYAQGPYYGEMIPEGEVAHLLKMVRRSESKLQPRGFFRTKPKKKKTARTQGAGREALPTMPGTLAPTGSRNIASLSNSAVRSRPRAQPAPAPQSRPSPHPQSQNGAPPRGESPAAAAGSGVVPPPLPPNPLLSNGAAGRPPPLATQAVASQSTAPTAPPPLDSAAMGGKGPAKPLAPAVQATPPPPLPQQSSPRGEKGPPPRPADADGPPRGQPKRVDPPAAAPAQPLAAAPAVARASPQPPPQTSKAPAKPRSTTQPAPDFSKLPPSIAESLARLAGTLDQPAPKPTPANRSTEPSDV